MLSAFYRFLGLISSTDKVASKREKSYVCALCRDFFLPSYFCCRTRFVEHGEQGGGAAHQFHLMKILLVDEEPGVILALQAAIENATSHTVRGSTGDLAIAAAEEMGGIDLLIAEAVMQPVDGFTLSLSLGRRFPALQTLFITGFDLDGFDHIVHGRKLLLKPLNPAEVLQAIAELQIAPPATILSLATSAAGSKGKIRWKAESSDLTGSESGSGMGSGEAYGVLCAWLRVVLLPSKYWNHGTTPTPSGRASSLRKQPQKRASVILR